MDALQLGLIMSFADSCTMSDQHVAIEGNILPSVLFPMSLQPLQSPEAGFFIDTIASNLLGLLLLIHLLQQVMGELRFLLLRQLLHLLLNSLE